MFPHVQLKFTFKLRTWKCEKGYIGLFVLCAELLFMYNVPNQPLLRLDSVSVLPRRIGSLLGFETELVCVLILENAWYNQSKILERVANEE